MYTYVLLLGISSDIVQGLAHVVMNPCILLPIPRPSQANNTMPPPPFVLPGGDKASDPCSQLDSQYLHTNAHYLVQPSVY